MICCDQASRHGFPITTAAWFEAANAPGGRLGILLHLAEGHAGLLPREAKARAEAITWLFAALDTVEPPIVEREMATHFEHDQPWYEQRLRLLDDRVRARLAALSFRLGEAPWLGEGFSAGDLMMVTVLLRLKGTELLGSFPKLAAYLARGEARPAFQRAFAAQRAVFEASSAAPR